MATRYHLLPSQVLCQADSLDVLIMDTALGYQTAKQKEAMSKADNKPLINDISNEQLTAMMSRVKNKDK